MEANLAAALARIYFLDGKCSDDSGSDFGRNVPTAGAPARHPKGVSFYTEVNFFKIFGANPVPWDANNTKMLFFPIETAFFFFAHKRLILKVLWEAPKNQARFHIGGLKSSP